MASLITRFRLVNLALKVDVITEDWHLEYQVMGVPSCKF